MIERKAAGAGGVGRMPPVRAPKDPGPAPEQILSQILQEQRQTNQLLLMLVDALAEEDEEEPPITHYMDGTPI